MNFVVRKGLTERLSITNPHAVAAHADAGQTRRDELLALRGC